MASVKSKCHLNAISENLELGLIAGVLSCGIDTLWCVMDTIHNGIHWHYILITTVLLLATAILSVALVRHHKNNVKQEVGALLAFKKHLNKCKNRHHRK